MSVLSAKSVEKVRQGESAQCEWVRKIWRKSLTKVVDESRWRKSLMKVVERGECWTQPLDKKNISGKNRSKVSTAVGSVTTNRALPGDLISRARCYVVVGNYRCCCTVTMVVPPTSIFITFRGEMAHSWKTRGPLSSLVFLSSRCLFGWQKIHCTFYYLVLPLIVYVCVCARASTRTFINRSK